jgi:hypothetical protein
MDGIQGPVSSRPQIHFSGMVVSHRTARKGRFPALAPAHQLLVAIIYGLLPSSFLLLP